MKALTNLLRLTVLAACATWLMTRTTIVHAQIYECPEYEGQNGNPCTSCCRGGTEQQNVYTGFILSGLLRYRRLLRTPGRLLWRRL